MVSSYAGIYVMQFAGVRLDSVGYCHVLIAFNISAPAYEMRDA